MLFIEAQLAELRALAKRDGLEIVQEFVEKRSTKMPGRLIFEDMVRRIERGEAQGIVCWKIDRLSHNPVDSGRISWLLQQGTIQKIHTRRTFRYFCGPEGFRTPCLAHAMRALYRLSYGPQ